MLTSSCRERCPSEEGGDVENLRLDSGGEDLRIAASSLGTRVLIADAAFMTGAGLGFLFAIPKIRQGDDVVIAANTNLEQISDWLTKILVGVGLIRFREIGSALNAPGDNLSESLGGPESSDTMGLAICLYFATGGFLTGYILTRLLLPVALRSAD